jgi:hypothetical protein
MDDVAEKNACLADMPCAVLSVRVALFSCAKRARQKGLSKNVTVRYSGIDRNRPRGPSSFVGHGERASPSASSTKPAPSRRLTIQTFAPFTMSDLQPIREVPCLA